jgi:hypothetical protein
MRAKRHDFSFTKNRESIHKVACAPPSFNTFHFDVTLLAPIYEGMRGEIGAVMMRLFPSASHTRVPEIAFPNRRHSLAAPSHCLAGQSAKTHSRRYVRWVQCALFT